MSAPDATFPDLLPDGGGNPNPGAGGSTRVCRCQEPGRPYMQFQVSRSTMREATELANSAGMSYQTWARVVIEAAVAEAEADR